MLNDLKRLLEQDPARTEADFREASNALLTQQFLYLSNERQARFYRTVMDHTEYFRNLVRAVGWTLFVDTDFGYVGVLPENDESYLGLGLDATLLLLVARQMFEEAFETHQTREGRFYVTTEDLLTRYETLSHRVRPNKGLLKDILATFVRHGVVARGEDGEQAGMPILALLPALRQIAGENILKRIEAHVAAADKAEGAMEIDEVPEQSISAAQAASE
jgi:hypothetical protein